MIMNAALTPVHRLVVKDISVWCEGLVLASVQDAVGVGVFRLQETVDSPVITTEREPVVIPVGRHCQSIGNKCAFKCVNAGMVHGKRALAQRCTPALRVGCFRGLRSESVIDALRGESLRDRHAAAQSKGSGGDF